MKSSSTNPSRPVRRSEAIGYALINQFATPGLGSWLGRRRTAAVGQLTLAILGFLIVVSWFLLQMVAALRLAGVSVTMPAFLLDHVREIAITGWTLFGLAWLWALITSILMIAGAWSETVPPSPAPPALPRS